MKKEIENLIKNSIEKLRKGKIFPKFEIKGFTIEHPKEKIHGDYSTNVAILIGKLIKKNPMEVAKVLIDSFKKSKSVQFWFEKIEAKEPGFINFFLSKAFLLEQLKKILKERGKYGSSKEGKGKTIVVDYSSPNIAKPFGIGHLRSTIIGQAIYNIYKFLGFKCIGDNHLGDWGTQFGKLIFAVKKWGKKKIKDYTVEDLEELYIRFHQEAQKDPKLEEEARKWFKKLEEGDKEARKIWKSFVKISLKEFNRIYKILGVKIDYALGESFYEKMLRGIIKEAIEKKIAVKSQGALVIKYPKDEFPPAIILKSDGATTYFTRDLATIKYRLKRWRPELIIYEVGVDQTLHFQQLFRAVELFGWAKKEKFVHVAHGLYRTQTGKFSTRRGETVHLEEVLKEAIERAKEIIEKSEAVKSFTKKEKEEIAKIVGIGAVKYNDLKQHPSKDIIFDWDKILNLKGNSGPYLQYTFVRCQSVLKKAGWRGFKKLIYQDFNKEEFEILRQICKFPEIVSEAAKRFSPNLICDFIFDLSQKYNLFYDLYPIIKAQDKNQREFRLALTFAVAQVLKNAFNLLGISVPQKM